VSAIIDGTGSIGAAVGPMLAPVVSGDTNWVNVFYMCIAADIVATIALLRIGYGEWQRLRRGWDHGGHAGDHGGTMEPTSNEQNTRASERQ